MVGVARPWVFRPAPGVSAPVGTVDFVGGRWEVDASGRSTPPERLSSLAPVRLLKDEHEHLLSFWMRDGQAVGRSLSLGFPPRQIRGRIPDDARSPEASAWGRHHAVRRVRTLLRLGTPTVAPAVVPMPIRHPRPARLSALHLNEVQLVANRCTADDDRRVPFVAADLLRLLRPLGHGWLLGRVARDGVHSPLPSSMVGIENGSGDRAR